MIVQNIENVTSEALLSNIEIWDSLAGNIRSTFPINDLRLENHIYPESKVLEYGCGDGRVLFEVCRLKPAKIVGYDTSAKMCELAKAKVPEAVIKLIKDPLNFTLEETDYDVVLLIGVLSSIVGVKARLMILDRVCRSSRAGSKIIVADFGKSNTPLYRFRYSSEKIEPFTFRSLEGLWIHHYTADELAELVHFYANICRIQTLRVKTVHENSIPGHVVIARRKNFDVST